MTASRGVAGDAHPSCWRRLPEELLVEELLEPPPELLLDSGPPSVSPVVLPPHAKAMTGATIRTEREAPVGHGPNRIACEEEARRAQGVAAAAPCQESSRARQLLPRRAPLWSRGAACPAETTTKEPKGTRCDRVRHRGRIKATKTQNPRSQGAHRAGTSAAARGNARRGERGGPVLAMPSPGMPRASSGHLPRPRGHRTRGPLRDGRHAQGHHVLRRDPHHLGRGEGDEPLRIMQRAGHSSFETTLGYIREAENLSRYGSWPALPCPPCEPAGSFGFGFGFRPRERWREPEKKGCVVGATGFEPVTSSV